MHKRNHTVHSSYYAILRNIYYLGSFYLDPIHNVLLHIMCSEYKLW